MTNSKLIGKLILKATITNKSPLLIASGKGDEVDFEVIKDSSGKPFIPGAGFAGMLRDSFKDIDNLDATHFKYFWGSDDNKDSSQSHIIIDDLKLDGECKIVERDGVAIDHETNLGIDGSKFDYELIEPEAKYKLNSEITLREGFDKNIFLEFLYFIAQNGKEKHYQQGAFKSSGFGILEWSDIKIYEFDFPEQGKEWFKYLENSFTPKNIYENISRSSIVKNILTIEGEFEIKNSLIISSKGDETISHEKAPDKTHLKDSSGKKALITGKSIKGAIRHRAHKILNTIGNNNADVLINNLFGYVQNKDAAPSRIKSFESEIENCDIEQIQPRIKIDRFTGGTIEHALMQSQPVWHKDEKITLKFEIKDCKEEEAGLMLLVMKDLMNEDLPVGGEKAIGRGVLKGNSLNVSGKIDNINDIKLVFDSNGIKDKKQVEKVNTLISSLSKTT